MKRTILFIVSDIVFHIERKINSFILFLFYFTIWRTGHCLHTMRDLGDDSVLTVKYFINAAGIDK
jgi:hypothetical protein